ncbi:hypothetical protein Taro_038533, partial [Colocasia esculenta]|nr:hypothetical protein [Colocasia esculenta]
EPSYVGRHVGSPPLRGPSKAHSEAQQSPVGSKQTKGRPLGRPAREGAFDSSISSPVHGRERGEASAAATAMDRLQLLLLGIPLFLFCSDLVSLFTPPPRPPRPPPPPHHHHHHHHDHHDHLPSQPPLGQTPDIASLKTGGLGYGNTVELNFCTSCSYRGNALTTKKMLETSFPGIDVVLSNYPPPLPKRLLSKLVPVVQAGVFGIVMAGDQILPRLGYVVLPPWYHSLRANRFGTIASTWLLGNLVQNFLQSSGAFEVYCNGDLVFSKLKEHRFPGEIELRNLINERIGSPRFGAEGSIWS